MHTGVNTEDPRPGSLEVAFSSLLEQQPDAIVAAVSVEGLFVPFPDSIDIGTHRIAQVRWALDLVDPVDREPVMAAWERAKEVGGARLTVTIAGPAAAQGSLHMFDLRPTHGVFTAALVGLGNEAAELDTLAAIAPAPPRLVRTRKDGMSIILEADADLPDMLGWEHPEYIGRRSLDFIHPDDHDTAVNTWMEVLNKPGALCRSRIRHLHRDGRWIWLEIANRNNLNEDGTVHCEMFDISEEMAAHDAVRASEQLLRRLAGALPVGVAHLDAEQRVVYANDRLREIVGARPGTDDQRLIEAVVDRDLLEEVLATVVAGADADIELVIDRLDGTGRRRCTVALRALTDAAGVATGAVGCLTDVTDATRMRAELERRAMFDHLTGCVNRATAIETLHTALASAGATRTAVLYVDLDGFKEVNDQLGHAAGDSLLIAMANRFRTAMREGDVVGRIGGDEFLVVCHDVVDEVAALALGDRVADAASAPIELADEVVIPRASTGVAWAGATDRASAESLIAAADNAMYASKAAGRGRPVLAGSRLP